MSEAFEVGINSAIQFLALAHKVHLIYRNKAASNRRESQCSWQSCHSGQLARRDLQWPSFQSAVCAVASDSPTFRASTSTLEAAERYRIWTWQQLISRSEAAKLTAVRYPTFSKFDQNIKRQSYNERALLWLLRPLDVTVESLCIDQNQLIIRSPFP